MRGWIADRSVCAGLVGLPFTPANSMLPLRFASLEYREANCAGTFSPSAAMLAVTIGPNGLAAFGSKAYTIRLYFSVTGALMS